MLTVACRFHGHFPAQVYDSIIQSYVPHYVEHMLSLFGGRRVTSVFRLPSCSHLDVPRNLGDAAHPAGADWRGALSDPDLWCWCLPVVCYLLCVARVICSFWSARYAGIAVAQGESAGHPPQLVFQFYVDKIAAMVTTQVRESMGRCHTSPWL